MSTTEDRSAAMDAASFDLDAWIDDVVRPEIMIELYPFETDFAAKVAAIEAQIPAAEASTPEMRGLDDPSPESLSAQLAVLRAERSRTALKVRVRQLTDTEIADTIKAAVAAGEGGPETINLWHIAAACVEPAFTVDQLKRLGARDRSGESMVTQLLGAVWGLMGGLPVPSSPAP